MGIGVDPGYDAPPVFRAPDHDLDVIMPSVAARVVFHDRLVRLLAEDADLYSLSANAFLSQSASCPRSANSHSAFGRSPGSTAAGVVADLSGQHMDPHLAALRISNGVQFAVHAVTDADGRPIRFSEHWSSNS